MADSIAKSGTVESIATGSNQATIGLTRSQSTAEIPAILFVWARFGPSHIDRCDAAGRHFAGRFSVFGVEIASFDAIYEWDKSSEANSFTKITLFPDGIRTQINPIICFMKLAATCLRVKPKAIFLCNYEDPTIFLLSLLLRGLGIRVFVLQDSKMDDKPRHIVMELVKYALYSPYQGAIVGGARSADYLGFLGVPRQRIAIGYNAVSLRRIRHLAGSPPAPDGMPHSERHFTIIARFVPQKNIMMALEAYAEYVAALGESARELHLCGSGALEPAFRAFAVERRLDKLVFRGFLQEEGIAKALASTLALVLPSTQEPFGLVVNEAIAMGVPVLISHNPGARDLLVRANVNGFVFEPDGVASLVHYLTLLDRDAQEWTRLSLGTRQFEAPADVAIFTEALEKVLADFD